MISKLCNICNSKSICRYCITHGKNIGRDINAHINYCKTCSSFQTCIFCQNYGKNKGKYYYKTYIDYVKTCYNR